jgi:hypothetical protein
VYVYRRPMPPQDFTFQKYGEQFEKNGMKVRE